MAAPTLRADSAPHDRLTFTELRDDIAVAWWGASSFSSGLTAAQQNQIDRVIADGFDRVSAEAFGHEQFRRQESVSYVNGQADYGMQAACRKVVSVKETVGGKTRNLIYVPFATYEEAWGHERRSTHPFLTPEDATVDSATAPRFWTFLGYSDDDPPLYIVRVFPTPDAGDVGGTMTVLQRPWLGTVADTYNDMPPAAPRAVLLYAKMILGADKGMDVSAFRALYQDEIRVLQIHEADATEQPTELQVPNQAQSEWGSPA